MKEGFERRCGAALMLAAKFRFRERRENICSVKATGGRSGSKSSCAYLVPGRKGGNLTGKEYYS